jgi:threonine dehydrogenase-like Zn-dependent dehydrogenase
MKQAILYGAEDLRLEDRDLDAESLQPDHIYVETEVSALSTGTDLANYLGDSTYVPGAPDYPRPVGYSNVGRVVRVGASVRKWRVGQRIFSTKPHLSAYIGHEDELLIEIPEAVSSDEASLAYLTHLGIAALSQAGYRTGENVVIVGLGVIGLCTVALARAMGARVVGIANSSIRTKVADRLGAHGTFHSGDAAMKEQLICLFGEAGADIVVLTANPWRAYRLSMELATYGGRICLLGFPGRGEGLPDFNPLDPKWIYAKQLTLLGSGYAPRTECPPGDLRFNTRRNLQYILSLMASRDLCLSHVITHRLPADRMKEAYELAKQHSKEMIAAVFDWRGH